MTTGFEHYGIDKLYAILEAAEAVRDKARANAISTELAKRDIEAYNEEQAEKRFGA